MGDAYIQRCRSERRKIAAHVSCTEGASLGEDPRQEDWVACREEVQDLIMAIYCTPKVKPKISRSSDFSRVLYGTLPKILCIKHTKWNFVSTIRHRAIQYDCHGSHIYCTVHSYFALFSFLLL